MSYKGRYESSILRALKVSGGHPTTLGTRQGVELSATTTSRKAYLKGIASGAAVTITGGQYSLDGGAWTSGAGTWGASSFIQASGTSSSNYETSTTVTVTIGGVQYDFVVTTRAIDSTPTAFSFTAVTDASPSTEYESNEITVTGIDATATPAITATDLEYSVNSGAYTSTAGTVELNDTVTVKLTSSADYETPISGMLTIGGVSATYLVTTGDDPTTYEALTIDMVALTINSEALQIGA